MKIMKLFASCAMVGALTAVCASGAFAASSADICSDYVADEGDGVTTGYVTVTAADGDYTAAGDYTVLVYPAKVEENGEAVNLDEVAIIKDSYIKQIDQNSTGTFTLKFDGLADGEYYVRLGGDENGYVYDTFTVGEGDPEQVYIGSPDGDLAISMNDCTEIFNYMAGKDGSIKDGEVLDAINYAAAAYCDGDNAVSMNDCTEIFNFMAGKSPEFVGKTVNLGQYAN